METQNVSRKEREYRVYREEILSATEKVFAAKGFFPITMSDIAREAEFGTGTPYSKLEAVLEIFLGKAQRMERRR